MYLDNTNASAAAVDVGEGRRSVGRASSNGLPWTRARSRDYLEAQKVLVRENQEGDVRTQRASSAHFNCLV